MSAGRAQHPPAAFYWRDGHLIFGVPSAVEPAPVSMVPPERPCDERDHA